ncbi:MAG: hypothetical protein VR76_12840 [Pseudomonas sp. BRH_c35]|nr:MAG: hypothetical protein VR76_12840 [Pseudomonas sp. BRH_c35]
MIYSFGAKNFCSFKEGMNISFELNAKVPKNVSQGRKASTVLGIKGANASGKTGVLKALSFISSFASLSFNNADEDPIRIISFFNNEKPSEFYIDFEFQNVRYIYELKATKDEVLREALYKKISRRTLIFERIKNEVTKKTSDLEEIDLIKLRSNASLISTATRYKLNKPNKDLFNVFIFFSLFEGNVYSTGVLGDAFYSPERASKFYNEHPEALSFAKKIISKCDLGISDIRILERSTPNNEKEFFPIFLHDAEGIKNEKGWLTSHSESSGTIALYSKLYLYWNMLRSGGVLVMDEFDVHCHPMLLPHLIELFVDKESNKTNAQFLFTAHSTDIIDFLGKYRVILVNKDKSESFCYRLDEIPGDLVRNDRPIAPLYRDGKIGGVPRYGE